METGLVKPKVAIHIALRQLKPDFNTIMHRFLRVADAIDELCALNEKSAAAGRAGTRSTRTDQSVGPAPDREGGLGEPDLWKKPRIEHCLQRQYLSVSGTQGAHARTLHMAQ